MLLQPKKREEPSRIKMNGGFYTGVHLEYSHDKGLKKTVLLLTIIE